jgi:hypothetical protein
MAISSRCSGRKEGDADLAGILHGPRAAGLLRAGRHRESRPGRIERQTGLPDCAGGRQAPRHAVRVDRAINSPSADERRAVPQEKSKLLLDDMHAWLLCERETLSRSAEVLEPINYILRRWADFARFLDDGGICLTNNCAERALRGIALGRPN